MQDRLSPSGQKGWFADPDLEKYCAMGIEAGATDAKQVHPGSVITAPWVRLKCQYGCPAYGHGHCCPPYTPTPAETRVVLDSYHRGILFHIEVPDMPHKEKHYRRNFEKLVDMEGTIFKDGFYKAFLYLSGPCRMCRPCAAVEKKSCNFPARARPSMEGCGIDVYQTARTNGFFIRTLSEKTDTNNEYCLMLVD